MAMLVAAMGLVEPSAPAVNDDIPGGFKCFRGVSASTAPRSRRSPSRMSAASRPAWTTGNDSMVVRVADFKMSVLGQHATSVAADAPFEFTAPP